MFVVLILGWATVILIVVVGLVMPVGMHGTVH